MRPHSLIFVCLAVLLTAAPASAHKERPIVSPPRSGPVPDLGRVNPNTLLVCKPTSKLLRQR